MGYAHRLGPSKSRLLAFWIFANQPFDPLPAAFSAAPGHFRGGTTTLLAPSVGQLQIWGPSDFRS